MTLKANGAQQPIVYLIVCLFQLKNSRWKSSRTSQTSVGTFSDLHRSTYTYLTFVCLCHTYRNSVFVIPTLNISDVVIYVIPIGIRCVACYIKHT
jgi:hypothetical protein